MSVSKLLAAREMGAELRGMRNAAGFTLRALEQAVGISNAKISMWENGHRLPKLDELNRVLDALGVQGDNRARLLGKWRAVQQIPAEIIMTASTSTPLAQLIEHEHAARRITTVAPLLMPGLLQTSGYARAILGDFPDASSRIATRVGRADILHGREPVELHALIVDEVLTTPLAPRDAMADQLRHLVKMAALPNVTIQVIESHGVGYRPYMSGAFILIEFPSAPPIVYLEHFATSATVWDEVVVRRYVTAAESLAQLAMSPARSAEVVAELADGLEIRT